MAYGPAAGLEIVDGLRDEPTLAGYHLLPAVRGDLLVKLDRHEEAAEELARAAAMTRNGPERTLLLERAATATRRGVQSPEGQADRSTTIGTFVSGVWVGPPRTSASCAGS
jgi:hypothetical protein